MYFILLGIIAISIALDRLTKWLVVTHIQLGESVDVIPNVFRFTYIQNRGAAFGMFADHRWVFMILSTVAIGALLVYLWFKRNESKWFTIPLALIVGGGIGNMIDRIYLKYVIDFFDFCAFPNLWYWIFNFADACVVVGAFMLGFYLIFEIVKEYKKTKQQPKEQTEEPKTEEVEKDSNHD